MKNLKIIIFILFIILPFPVFASYEHFKVWDMSDGLSNNTVKSITQDHLGFIWLGTFDGLCKFDGVDFTIFRHDLQDSLSIINNHVEVVASVRDELWVGTERGLNLYSYKENNFRLCEWILPTGERQKITESIKNIVVNQESVFILTFSHQLLVRKEGCVFEPCDYKKNIEWLSISGYKEGLLIGHATDGLYVIDPDEMRIRAHFPFDSKILSDCLYYSTNKDMIFLGFGIGYPSLAFRMNKENSLEKLEVRIPSSVKTIVDYKDETLFGTDGNGLMVFNESGCSDISSGESDMSSDAIYSLFVDRRQNLWIGTYRGGLNASSEHYDWFQSFCIQNKKLSYDMVTAVVSQKERLYVGLDGGGLNIYDVKNDKLLKYTTHNSGISGDNLFKKGLTPEVRERSYVRFVREKKEKAVQEFGRNNPTFSSSHHENQVAGFAADGNLQTYWQASKDDPAPFWILDTEKELELKNIQVRFPKESIYRYVLEVSGDKVHWTVVSDKQANRRKESHIAMDFPDAGVRARFVRIRFVKKSPAVIAEVTVRGIVCE